LQPICLVMELIELLAEDLVGILSEVWPEARVLVTSGPSEALALLEREPKVDVAFLNASPADRSSPVVARLADQGTGIIMMGDEAETNEERREWVVLQRPFSAREVVRALEQVGIRLRHSGNGPRPDPG
jgi:hypothetical protein